MTVEHGWAIKSKNYGFYYGWNKTRLEAIAAHVDDIEGCGVFLRDGKLDDYQRAGWDRAKRRGDRAVKITISEGWK